MGSVLLDAAGLLVARLVAASGEMWPSLGEPMAVDNRAAGPAVLTPSARSFGGDEVPVGLPKWAHGA